LALIGDEAGLEAVLSAVSANDPNVRASAVRALGPFSGEAVDRAILDGFRDSFFRTRIAAAQASRDRKLEAAVPYLQFRAERDDVPQVREESIRALGAIASEEAMEVLNTLFRERRNSDRVRLVSAEMLMQNAGEQSLTQIIIEMDYARGRNQTALYNGFLRIAGEAVITGDTSGIESLARRFMQNGGVLERLFGLDMAANNNLTSLEAEIKTLAEDRNESIARRARRTAERLGIDLDEEES
jgi:HEAT repeat protein